MSFKQDITEIVKQKAYKASEAERILMVLDD